MAKSREQEVREAVRRIASQTSSDPIYMSDVMREIGAHSRQAVHTHKKTVADEAARLGRRTATRSEVQKRAAETPSRRAVYPRKREATADKLRQFQERPDLTQQDIAEQTQLSPATVREYGIRRKGTPEWLEKLRANGRRLGASSKGVPQSPEHVARRMASTRETYAEGRGKKPGRKPKNPTS